MQRIVIVALSLAHRLLDTPLPADVLELVTGDRTAARLTAQIARRLFRPPGYRHVWRDWMSLCCREHVSDKLRYGFRIMTTEHVVRYWDLSTARREARRAQGLTPPG
jgi:hypothetical protein